MATRRGADLIFDYLNKEKVPYLFGAPGHGVMGLMAALPESQGNLKIVTVHHEQVAGFMADAYYRVAHRPVATFSSCGPGSANMPIALANAMMDESAFLAITGNVATNQFNRGTFQEVYRYHQAEFPATIRPYVKRSFQVVRPDMLPLALRQSFTLMTTGRPGPVHLDVPYNLFGEDAAGLEAPDPREWREGIDSRVGASPEAVRRVLRDLLAAERPVMLVGNGAVLAEAEEEIKAVAELLEIPVAYSPLGIGALDGSHPLCLGSVGRNGAYPSNEATSMADVLLALGAQFDDRATSAWLPGSTLEIPPTRLIQVELDPEDLGRNYPVSLGITADVRTLLRQLLEAARQEGARGRHGKWVQETAAWKAEWAKYNDEHYRPEAQPINGEHVIRTLRKVFPRDGILAVDVGSHHTWVVSRWDAYKPRTVIQAWGYGAMGFGAAGALGAKLAAPDKPVLAIVGDGGFLMCSNVVATAVEYGIPVTWVIWNNAGYGVTATGGYAQINRFKNQATGELLPHDCAALGRAYGGEGVIVEKPGDLGDAVDHAIKSGKPTVVDVRVDLGTRPIAVGAWQLPPDPPTPADYPRRQRPR